VGRSRGWSAGSGLLAGDTVSVTVEAVLVGAHNLDASHVVGAVAAAAFAVDIRDADGDTFPDV
jgi:hypothetical protein